MKALKFFILCCFVSFSLFVAACGGGGGGGGSSDSGTVAMSVTDAKPLLPENVANLFVEFSEVWVNKSGEGWKQLTLVESPYTIDLLQFQDGSTTELVPPTILDSGKYTQVRIAVSSAMMRFNNDDGTTEDRTVEIPSENLKTDKNFTIDVADDSAMDIVIHFDLSMSVVVSGPASNPTYKLKPVMHLFEDPLHAATINGSIDASSFVDSNNAIIVVLDEENEEFTRLEVAKESATDPTPFSIFWLVPNKSYKVQIDLVKDTETIDNDCHETVYDLEPGETYELNKGIPIIENDPNGICN
jgi:hypothetical protein